MITKRFSGDRGAASEGWLNSKHTFSFANYFDAQHMGFSVLRVINEDQIEGGTGFDTHGHQDMEIISYVVKGALEHKDSMGNKALILPGEVQRLSAGTGIRHSEKNHLASDTTHFFQIWILPDQKKIKPQYGQKNFVSDFEKNDLVLVISKDGRLGSISIQQDADLYICKSKIAGERTLTSKKLRNYWVQVIEGEIQVNSENLNAGDGAKIENEHELLLLWKSGAEFMVFDLP